MREIQITQGYTAFVDDEDYQLVSSYRWHVYRVVSCGKEYIYPRTTLSVVLDDGYSWKREVMMHRFLMSASPDEIVDHSNGNTLDNRRSNLRICTSAENTRNARKCLVKNGRPASSKYKGVSISPRNKKNPWSAAITSNGDYLYIGSFGTEEDAALVYDVAASIEHGRFAKLNFAEIVA